MIALICLNAIEFCACGLKDNSVFAFGQDITESTVQCALNKRITRYSFSTAFVERVIPFSTDKTIIAIGRQCLNQSKIVQALIVNKFQFCSGLGLVCRSYRSIFISKLNLCILFVTHSCTNCIHLGRISEIIFRCEMTVVS